MQELVEFQSASFRLTGIWTLPDNAGPAAIPAVFFCHGFTGNHIESKRLYARMSARLAGEGIASFRFDHRGCGDSSGDFLDFAPKGMLEDLTSAFEVFSRNVKVDHARCAVIGYSLGGVSASFLLSHWSGWVTAAIWAGVAQPEIIRDRLATYPAFAGYENRGYFDYGGFLVSKEYIDSVGEMKPLEWISQFAKPILFITGEEDPIVKPAQMKLFLETRKVMGDASVLIPGADHGFSTFENGDRVIRESLKWMVGHLLCT